MLGVPTSITSVLGAAPDPRSDTSVLKSFARAAVSAGLHLLLIEPMGKRPVDVRTSVQRRKEDRAAQDAAREAGRPDWDRVKSKAGVYLATDNPTLITRYIEAYRKTFGTDDEPNVPVNFGVAVGPSRLIVVDCDTRMQLEAFLMDWAESLDVECNLNVPPTVKSPGQITDGEWAHSDGGHFYFTIPDGVSVPDYSGSFTAPGEYAVLWADRYVLIPPSIRPEGPYRLVGQDFPVPEFLGAAIERHTSRKVRSAQDSDRNVEVADAVDAWARTIEWWEILTPAGWNLTARPDNCGCDVWTAPGDHGSPKSATAHDTACTLGRYTTENAPLHIWTDNPGPELEAWIRERGSKTVSKLQAIAVLEFAGDVGTAMRTLSVTPDDSEALAFGADLHAELGTSKANLDDHDFGTAPTVYDITNVTARTPDGFPLDFHVTPRPAGAPTGGTFTLGSGPAAVTLPYNATAEDIRAAQEQATAPADLFADPAGFTDDPSEPIPQEPPPFSQGAVTAPSAEADPDEPIQGLPIIRPFAEWRHLPPPEFVIEGLLEHRALSSLVGAPGVGKSGVALDMAAAICLGKRWMGRKTMRMPVLYLPGEGMSGAVQRLLAWEDAHDDDLGQDLLVGDSIIQVMASREAWTGVVAKILEFRVGLVIIDTFARATVGVEENSASEVGKAVAKFDAVRKATGAGVLVVHHSSKSGGSRGSSALNGALDTELTVRDGQWWDDSAGIPPGRVLQLDVTKQKNAAVPDNPVPMLAVPWDASFVMTGPSGVVDDPLDGTHSPEALTPEPVVNTAIRIKEVTESYTAQGITRGELTYLIPMDGHTARRRDAKTAWKHRISEAVDLALRYSLIETLTGAPTGARYIPGQVSAERARELWAAEMMSD